MADQSTATRFSRTLWVLLLILCSLWIGLVAGAAVGANLFVPAGSGFAAGPTALGYGVVGALTAAFMAILLAWKLPVPSVRRLALLAVLLLP